MRELKSHGTESLRRGRLARGRGSKVSTAQEAKIVDGTQTL